MSAHQGPGRGRAARMPSGDEVLKLPGSIVRIQAPGATLEWALYGRYQSAAFARLEVPCQ